MLLREEKVAYPGVLSCMATMAPGSGAARLSCTLVEGKRHREAGRSGRLVHVAALAALSTVPLDPGRKRLAKRAFTACSTMARQKFSPAITVSLPGL